MLTFRHRKTLVPGVTLRNGRWIARGATGLSGERVALGSFATAAEAEAAVLAHNEARGVPPQEWVPDTLLAELDPELNGEVLVPIPVKSAQRLWWRCAAGHPSWLASVHHRTPPDARGCPRCAGNVLTAERVQAVLAERDVELLGELHRSQKMTSWRCLRCESVFSMRWNDIQQGHGCPCRRRGGFSPRRSGYLYVLEFDGALKVGVTHHPENRLQDHIRQGSASTYSFLSERVPGWVAVTVEREVVRHWREQGLEAVDLPDSGSSETASGADVHATVDLIHKLLAERCAQFRSGSHRVNRMDLSDVRSFVSDHHYTGSCPPCRHAFGLHDENGRLVGVALYGVPAYAQTASSILDGAKGEQVLELRRLVLLDGVPRNAESWFLARTMKMLPPETEAVVAFSDASLHYGACYQAANFIYTGRTSPTYHYVSPEGAYLHKRAPWEWARQANTTEREIAEQRGLKRVEDPPRYRYVYPLTRRARREIQPRALPYPKPDLSQT